MSDLSNTAAQVESKIALILPKSNTGKLLLAGLVLLVAGFLVGKWTTPVKVVTKTVTVATDKEKVDRNIVSKTTKTTDKKGHVVETTVTIDKSKENHDIDSKTTSLKTISRDNSNWLVGGGVLFDRTGSRSYSLSVEKRFFGGLYLGVIGNSDVKLGLGFTLSF